MQTIFLNPATTAAAAPHGIIIFKGMEGENFQKAFNTYIQYTGWRKSLNSRRKTLLAPY
jgi:hypothetical protein